MIQALEALGLRVKVLDWEVFAAHPGLSEDAFWWIDSLFLDTCLKMPGLPWAQMGLLVHHLPIFEQATLTSEPAVLEAAGRPLQAFQAFWATSELTRNLLIKMGMGHRPIICIPPAFSGTPMPLPPNQGPLKAVMVANLIPRKGILAFLKTLGTCLSGCETFSLEVIGSPHLDPDYARACTQWVGQHPLLADSVRFIGALPHPQVMEHLASADVFISAATMETFGMAVDEATHMQVPVLALDRGYIARHFQEESAGFLHDTMEGLCKHLLIFIDAPDSLRALQKTNKSSPPSAYTWEQAARQYVREWEHLQQHGTRGSI